MKQIPELSKAEWLVMNECWKQGRCTARQIFDQAPSRKSWSYQTVKTMLDRLTAKGYLRCDKLGPLCLYEPAVARAGVVSRSIEAFRETVLGTTLVPLFAHLASERLSEDEIASLKKLIDEHDSEKKRGKGKKS